MPRSVALWLAGWLLIASGALWFRSAWFRSGTPAFDLVALMVGSAGLGVLLRHFWAALGRWRSPTTTVAVLGVLIASLPLSATAILLRGVSAEVSRPESHSVLLAYVLGAIVVLAALVHRQLVSAWVLAPMVLCLVPHSPLTFVWAFGLCAINCTWVEDMGFVAILYYWLFMLPLLWVALGIGVMRAGQQRGVSDAQPHG